MTDDDPQLDSLRAIWGSMRDEEPPEHGLAALMAAARAKAEEMKPRETWWQRLFAQLRRPPVLALAMLVLLVGGGVIISQRDDVQSRAVAEDHAALQEKEAPPSTPAPAATPMMDTDTEGAAPPAAEAADLPALDDKVAAPAPRPVTKRPAAKTRAPMKKQAPAAPRGGLQQPLSIATDEAPAAGAIAPPPPPPPPPPQAPATRGAVSIDELVKQCAAAAARGDCATAKRLATKIEQTDADVFRARVASDAKIKACL